MPKDLWRTGIDDAKPFFDVYDLWKPVTEEHLPNWIFPTESPPGRQEKELLSSSTLSTWKAEHQWILSDRDCRGSVCQYGSDGPITNLCVKIYFPMNAPRVGDLGHWLYDIPIPESFQLIDVGLSQGTRGMDHRRSEEWDVNYTDPRQSLWQIQEIVSLQSECAWDGKHYDLLIEACRIACWEIVKRYQDEPLIELSEPLIGKGRRIAR